jgi:hypothetical protein
MGEPISEDEAKASGTNDPETNREQNHNAVTTAAGPKDNNTSTAVEMSKRQSKKYKKPVSEESGQITSSEAVSSDVKITSSGAVPLKKRNSDKLTINTTAVEPLNISSAPPTASQTPIASTGPRKRPHEAIAEKEVVPARRGRGRPRSSRTKKGKEISNVVALTEETQTPVVAESVVEQMDENVSEQQEIRTNKRARFAGKSEGRREMVDSGLRARLKEEWKDPPLCADSVVTFAEHGVWRDGQNDTGVGVCLRHVRQRRAGTFDDLHVMCGMRFIVKWE